VNKYIHSLVERKKIIYSSIMFYPTQYDQQISNEVREKRADRKLFNEI
jgi:hypothetical protein